MNDSIVLQIITLSSFYQKKIKKTFGGCGRTRTADPYDVNVVL